MHSNTGIPFLDLVTPHRELEEELVAALRSALSNAGFIGGPKVEAFESEFASFCGAGFSVAVNSGTDALRFALLAAGVGPEHVVITVPHTFIATTEAISQTGAQIEFVDIDERTCNMDPEELHAWLATNCEPAADGGYLHRESGKKVKAVVPVHLYGQMADMDAILAIAEKYKLTVIEDACQAHGAEYYSQRNQCWQKAGSIGAAAAFSFYPGKNLGACGEAGAVTTNDPTLAQKVKVLRDHGQAQKYYHDIEGYNGRLDAIQAAFLSIKLKHLDKWNSSRREHATLYNQLFQQYGMDTVILPFEHDWSRAVYHLYVIRVADREALREALTQAGVGVGIHYPVPLHLQKAYAARSYKAGDFPVTERVASQILSLPMFPGLTGEQVKRVVELTKAHLDGSVISTSVRIDLPAIKTPSLK